MKGSIITCQYAYNYGAVLQAYALCHYMESLGLDMEVVDYRPSYQLGLSKSKNKLTLFVRFLIRIPDHIKGKKVFNAFLEHYIPLTRSYTSCEELQMDPPKSDLFIAGSDQIWNFDLPNGWDPSFYLSYADSSKCRVSYAASLSCDKLTSEEEAFLKEKLAGFDAISVRENTGRDLLKACGFENVQTVSDPVYLLKDQAWRDMEQKPQYKMSRKYILVIAFNRQSEIFRAGKKLAQEKGYDVYSVNTYCEDIIQHTDHYFWNCKPEEFLYLIDHAECIVTNSFHGLSFSLIFNKPVLFFEKNDNGNSRMKDLLAYLEIEDKVFVKNRENIAIPKLDFKDINRKILQLQTDSRQYIKDCILCAEKKNEAHTSEHM